MPRTTLLVAALLSASLGSAAAAAVAAELHGRWTGSCTSYAAKHPTTNNFQCISSRITTAYEITYNATAVSYISSAGSITIADVTYSVPEEVVDPYPVTQDGYSISDGETCYYARVEGGVMTEVGKYSLPAGVATTWDACGIHPPPADTCTTDSHFFYKCTLTRASGAASAAAASLLVVLLAVFVAAVASVTA